VTFFVLPGLVESALAGWREATERDHEIGNHSLTHPCSGNFAWTRDNPLERLTLKEYKSELSEANRRLRYLLGISPRVFAYPCGHTSVGRGHETRSVVPLVSEMFDAGRTFNDLVANSPRFFDPFQIACVNSDEKTFAELLPHLEAARADRAWLVLGGHEIGHDSGVGRRETTQVGTIEAVVSWCRTNRIWIDTVGNVARVGVAHQHALIEKQTREQGAPVEVARSKSREAQST